MTAIRRATVNDRVPLTNALASAFADDPLFRWMAGPKAPLEQRMRAFFGAFVNVNLRKPDHLVYVADDASGGAIWQPVGKWKVAPTDLVRSMPGIIRAFRTRVPAMVGALNAIEKVHPKEPHFYLEILGTRQDHQSKGIGSAVIRSVLDQADEQGLPAYLESSNPRNIPFYARHGFEVREVVDCGKGAPPCTTMWREPRG